MLNMAWGAWLPTGVSRPHVEITPLPKLANGGPCAGHQRYRLHKEARVHE
jgi:hypothetical protein